MLTTGGTSTSVASLLAFLVAALSKIIGASVDNDGATEDAVVANQLDELVGNGSLSVALAVGLEVAEVTNVALVVGWRAVLLAVRVD